MLLVAVLSLLLAAPGFGDDVQSQLWSNMRIMGSTHNNVPAVGAQTAASWLDSLKLLSVGASTSEEVVVDEEACNVGINAACGGRKKCCDDLACSPVWDDYANKFLAKCVVTDASLLDVTSCYGGDQKCFYHYQCCSHRCNDADGDKVFTCDTADDTSADPTDATAISTISTISTTSTPQAMQAETTTVVQQEAEEAVDQPGKGGRTNFETHWGNVDSKIPLSFIVMFGIVAFVVLGVAILKVAQKISRHQYQALGVDKIPSPGRALRYDAEDWSILNKSPGQQKPGGGAEMLDTDSESESEPIPVLPARDYTSGETDAVAFSPTVPIVDY